MIYYSSKTSQNFSDYGIDVPIHLDREKQIFLDISNDHPDVFSLSQDQDVEPLSKEDLLRVHDKKFIEQLYTKEGLFEEMALCFDFFDEDNRPLNYKKEIQKKEFEDFFDRLRKQCRLSYMAMQKALMFGFSYHLGGGMHHAMSFGGRGFCLLNDMVIGIKKLQNANLIKKAWIVDVDAHKGDGTAELCYGDTSIQTLSIHMGKAWPLDGKSHDENNKLNPSFIPSDVDIAISKNEEDQYVGKLKEGLENLLKKSGEPDLVVIVQGADTYEEDVLESTKALKLTKEQMLQRDVMVHDFFADKKIPQTYVMAGGYGPKTWSIYTQFLRYALADR
jgi:acetoin utilization deacetylase AcuC-like enzyme